jgi:hypothetical protein
MKKFLCLLPLVAALASACEHQKHSTPLAPTPLTEIAPPAPPAPEAKVYPSTGPDVIAYVAATYPERLVAGVSREDRIANMQFLRDRVIEVGRCGGLDLGWNMKRGGPEISIDFITERVNGQVIGHDIGFDYDNTGTELRLQWLNGDFPFYGEYPSVECQ